MAVKLALSTADKIICQQKDSLPPKGFMAAEISRLQLFSLAWQKISGNGLT